MNIKSAFRNIQTLLTKKPKDQTDLLIGILLDKTAGKDERDDAAMELEAHQNRKALEALATIAADSEDDAVIVDSSAKSFAHICIGLSYFDEPLFRKMTSFAQRIVFIVILGNMPELVSHALRQELDREYKLSATVSL